MIEHMKERWQRIIKAATEGVRVEFVEVVRGGRWLSAAYDQEQEHRVLWVIDEWSLRTGGMFLTLPPGPGQIRHAIDSYTHGLSSVVTAMVIPVGTQQMAFYAAEVMTRAVLTESSRQHAQACAS